MSETGTAKPGVKPDIWLKHRSIYSESLINLQEATSENQARLKAAKADGIHIDAMKFVSKLNRKDPAEAAVFLRALLEGALIEKCAFMYQSDMIAGGSIADMFKIPAPSAKAVVQFKEAEATDIGYQEGLHGGSLDNLAKKFEPGSAALAAATRGFKRGQEFMKRNAVPGVVPVAPARGRRGGRVKNDEPSPAPVARRGRKAAAAVEAEPADDEPEAEVDEAEATSGGPVSLDRLTMDDVRALSNHKMAAVYRELTGSKLKKFESRGAGIVKFEQLLASRNESGLATAA